MTPQPGKPTRSRKGGAPTWPPADMVPLPSVLGRIAWPDVGSYVAWTEETTERRGRQVRHGTAYLTGRVTRVTVDPADAQHIDVWAAPEKGKERRVGIAGIVVLAFKIPGYEERARRVYQAKLEAVQSLLAARVPYGQANVESYLTKEDLASAQAWPDDTLGILAQIQERQGTPKKWGANHDFLPRPTVDRLVREGLVQERFLSGEPVTAKNPRKHFPTLLVTTKAGDAVVGDGGAAPSAPEGTSTPFEGPDEPRWSGVFEGPAPAEPTGSATTVWPATLPLMPPAPGNLLHFVSGASAPADLRGLVRFSVPLGVSVPELSAPALEFLLSQAGRPLLQVFVDSGAFSEVKIVNGRVVVVAPITEEDWAHRVEVALRVARAFGSRAHIVAPDRVGDQAETLARLRRWAPEMAEVKATGAHVIVPLQRGALSTADFEREAARAIGFSDFTAAIPGNKDAMPKEELEAYLRVRRPSALHILGMGPRNRRIAEMLEVCNRLIPGVPISCDSNSFSALVGSTNGRGGSARSLTANQSAFAAQGDENAREKARENAVTLLFGASRIFALGQAEMARRAHEAAAAQPERGSSDTARKLRDTPAPDEPRWSGVFARTAEPRWSGAFARRSA